MGLFMAIVPEQAVDGGRAAVDAPQHVACFAAQVPAQGEGVQVTEETHLHHAVSELLHPDPQEGAQVTDKTRGPWEEEEREGVTPHHYPHTLECDWRQSINAEWSEWLLPAPPPCNSFSRT